MAVDSPVTRKDESECPKLVPKIHDLGYPCRYDHLATTFAKSEIKEGT